MICLFDINNSYICLPPCPAAWDDKSRVVVPLRAL